jgi:hypothetical protein
LLFINFLKKVRVTFKNEKIDFKEERGFFSKILKINKSCLLISCKNKLKLLFINEKVVNTVSKNSFKKVDFSQMKKFSKNCFS